MEIENAFLDDRELESIVDLLKDRFAADFSGYARSSLNRRIARFRANYRISSFNELEDFLRASEKNVSLMIEEITVNTTEMFRDPEFWLFLRKTVIPKLGEHAALRIWHAGCSTGEEVYSMLILLHEAGLLDRCKVIATDINSEVLEKTKAGCFRKKDFESHMRSYLQAGGENDFSSYFEFRDEVFCAKEFLKAPLNLRYHNLVNAAPFSKFDLILCRNVMIYFNPDLQSEVVRLFSSSLFKNGFFCTGKKENIGFLDSMAALEVFSQEERIYMLRNPK